MKTRITICIDVEYDEESAGCEAITEALVSAGFTTGAVIDGVTITNLDVAEDEIED